MLTDHDNKSWTDAFVSQKLRYVLGDSAYYECYAFAFYLEELLVSNVSNTYRRMHLSLTVSRSSFLTALLD